MMVIILAMVSRETDKDRQRDGDVEYLQVLIIMEICKAPTPRLKALNKHNTHNVHRDGKCYPQFNKN